MGLLYDLFHIDSISTHGRCRDGKVHDLVYRKNGYIFKDSNNYYRFKNCGEMSADATDAEFRRCLKCGKKFQR